MTSKAKKPRVLHLVEPFAAGNICSVSQICKFLDDDFDFHILHGSRPETPADYKSWFPKSTIFHPWQVGREISIRGDSRALAQLKEVLRDVEPDVAHAHSSKAGALARIGCLFSKVPVVYSPRGYSFLRQDVSAVTRMRYRAIEYVLGRLPHITAACGVGEYAQALQVSRHCMVIPNMVDLRDFDGLPRPAPESVPLKVAMCGRIKPQKNFPLFCEVARALLGRKITFVWVGRGTPPTHMRIPENVHVTGWLSRSECLRAVASCHVFMQTSLWEGLPISMLEAMALGLPLLAYPAVGNTELVCEGVTGFLCDSVTSFVEKLQLLEKDRSLIRQLGKESLRRVKWRHNVTDLGLQWGSLYRYYARYSAYG